MIGAHGGLAEMEQVLFLMPSFPPIILAVEGGDALRWPSSPPCWTSPGHRARRFFYQKRHQGRSGGRGFDRSSFDRCLASHPQPPLVLLLGRVYLCWVEVALLVVASLAVVVLAVRSAPDLARDPNHATNASLVRVPGADASVLPDDGHFASFTSLVEDHLGRPSVRGGQHLEVRLGMRVGQPLLDRAGRRVLVHVVGAARDVNFPGRAIPLAFRMVFRRA